MTFNRHLGSIALCVAMLLLALPALGQTGRGKAEMSAAAGPIVVDYGRPQLKGRDPLTWQKDGSYWRMGSNDMTTLTTPADLAFGETVIPKGSYGLWLLKVSADRYELVLNSQTTGMGMSHDKSKDVASVPLRAEKIAAPVEDFTVELKPGARGGTFAMVWGTSRLSADFEIKR